MGRGDGRVSRLIESGFAFLLRQIPPKERKGAQSTKGIGTITPEMFRQKACRLHLYLEIMLFSIIILRLTPESSFYFFAF